jgi:hypothetical protein
MPNNKNQNTDDKSVDFLSKFIPTCFDKKSVISPFAKSDEDVCNEKKAETLLYAQQMYIVSVFVMRA